jgi:hypothetical protein
MNTWKGSVYSTAGLWPYYNSTGHSTSTCTYSCRSKIRFWARFALMFALASLSLHFLHSHTLTLPALRGPGCCALLLLPAAAAACAAALLLRRAYCCCARTRLLLLHACSFAVCTSSSSSSFGLPSAPPSAALSPHTTMHAHRRCARATARGLHTTAPRPRIYKCAHSHAPDVAAAAPRVFRTD